MSVISLIGPLQRETSMFSYWILLCCIWVSSGFLLLPNYSFTQAGFFSLPSPKLNAMVINKWQFVPQGTSGNIWRDSDDHNWGFLTTGRPGCFQALQQAQDSPMTKNCLAQNASSEKAEQPCPTATHLRSNATTLAVNSMTTMWLESFLSSLLRRADIIILKSIGKFNNTYTLFSFVCEVYMCVHIGATGALVCACTCGDQRLTWGISLYHQSPYYFR